jgi:DNA polymerase zeta
VATIVERSLRLLFEHPDLSRLRRYLERQFDKLLTGRVPLRDLVFCKEVRLGTYSDRVPPPPAAVVAMKRMARDPRAEPRYGERVSYVVVAGPPQARLVDLVLDPRRLLHPPPGEEPPLPNALYYITKQILPALDRLLGLVGADPVRWFQEMPRPARLSALRPRALAVVASSSSSSANHRTLDAFCLSTACLACEAPTCPAAGLCEACRSQPQPAALALVYRRRRLERHQVRQLAICLACTGARHPEQVHCSSLDCPVYFQTSSLALSLRSLDSLAAGLEW